jgi:hypothetical protein
MMAEESQIWKIRTYFKSIVNLKQNKVKEIHVKPKILKHTKRNTSKVARNKARLLASSVWGNFI